MLDWEEQQHEGGVEGFNVWDIKHDFIVGCPMYRGADKSLARPD